MRLIGLVVSTFLATSTFVQGQASNERIPAQRPIAGTVVNEQGTPIPGAQLWWSSGKGDIGFTADGDGRFKAMSPIEWNFFEGPAGLGTIRAKAEGYALTSKTVLGGDEQTRPELEIKLKLGRELESATTPLRVVDQEGRPIAGATVELSPFNNSLPPEVRGRFSQKTDAGGLVDFVRPDSRTSYLRVTSTTHGTQDFHLLSSSLTPKIRVLRYCPTGRIEVRIVGDEESRRGLQIEVNSDGPVSDQDLSEEHLKFGASPFSTSVDVTELDADGRFTIPAMVASKVFVAVRSPADGGWLAEMPRQFDVAEGATVSLEIPMTRGIPVTGRFVDNLTGDPVPGVTVMVNGFSERRTISKSTATTDQNGFFRTLALPGRASIQVTSTGSRGGILYLPPPPVGGPVIEIAPDSKEAEFPEIRLTSSRLIIGRVISKEFPVQSLRVTVDKLPYPGMCDEDGYFLLALPFDRKPQTYSISEWSGLKGESRLVSESPLVLEMLRLVPPR